MMAGYQRLSEYFARHFPPILARLEQQYTHNHTHAHTHARTHTPVVWFLIGQQVGEGDHVSVRELTLRALKPTPPLQEEGAGSHGFVRWVRKENTDLIDPIEMLIFL